MSAKTILAGTGQRRSSRGLSTISEAKEKSTTAPNSDGEDGEHDKICKEEGVTKTTKKKGG